MRRAALAALLVAGCTDAGLQLQEQPPPSRDDRLSVGGVICTRPPRSRITPLRVLFVVDASDSMDITDPPDPVTLETGRQRAVRETWTGLLEGEPEGVKVGVIRFSSEAQSLTGEDLSEPPDSLDDTFFTANRDILATATDILGVTNRATNYATALAEAFLVLRTEMQAAEEDSLPLSRYVVVFLSDGLPDGDRGNTREDAIDGVQELVDLARIFRVGQFEVNTAYLSAGRGPDLDREAQELLQEMAQVGGGSFRSFPSGESINFLFVDFTQIRSVFQIDALAALNLNAVTEVAQLAALPDTRTTFQDAVLGLPRGLPEVSGLLDMGMDVPMEPVDMGIPVSARTFTDRDGDGVPGCGEPLSDTDGDGLADVVESVVGTDVLLADTDDDGVRDVIEWRIADLDPTDPTDAQCLVLEPCELAFPGAAPGDANFGLCACLSNANAAEEGRNEVCDCADPAFAETGLAGCYLDPRGVRAERDCVDNPEIDPDATDPLTGLPLPPPDPTMVLGDGICDCPDENADGLCDYVDRDRDLLTDCEEQLFGTRQTSYDSDADAVPDLFEVLRGGAPSDPDSLDVDFDDARDNDELLASTDPLCDESGIRSRIAVLTDLESQGTAAGRTCYDFEVRNLTLVPTLPNEDAAYPGNGWNRVLVYASETSFDDPEAVGDYRVACVMVRYEPDGNFKNPPSGRLRLTDEDFADAELFDPDTDCIWP
ncbi:MAG: VWA domain-containing protein [Myxococcota bacterium]